jgi:hypothetical protein
MTGQPTFEAPPVDPGNPLVRHDYPAIVTTGYLNSPVGMRLALTVRVANATVTLVLARQEAIDLAGKISSDAANMPGGGLIVPTGMPVMPAGPTMPMPGANGGKP